MMTRVAGIPCQVEVTDYEAGYAAKTNADPDSCYEGEAPHIEFVLLDRKGYPAPWLEAKLTDADRERIEDELFKEMA